MNWLFVLIGAFVLDLIFGDPQGWPHPIRLIGKLIVWAEKKIRPLFPKTEKGELWAGAFFAVIVLIVTTGLITVILFFSEKVDIWFSVAVQTLLCYYLFAMKSLKIESMKVYDALIAGDLSKSRKAVSYIVGRDTEQLTEHGVMRATVETVAENCADGFVAPAFFVVIGGPIAGFLYKAVNTMDSMVGYRNDKYLYFGRFAAKLDDLLNFIPARLAAYSMVASAFLLRYDGKNAYKIFSRDRYNHKSPNSAQTEAACAGALGLRLAGPTSYFGVLHQKPYIGDELHQISSEDIKHANCLHYGASCISLLFLVVIKLLIIFFLN